jgi:hypothetical protein
MTTTTKATKKTEATSALRCLNSGDGKCKGEVKLRSRGDGKAFPRCDGHWTKRTALEQDLRRRYPVSAPSDFDPADAGESWDEP